MCVAHVCTMYGEDRVKKLHLSSLEIGITVFIYLFSFANITWENNKTKIHTRTQKRKKILFGRYTTTALANYCGPVG